ncbi:DUF4270 domain-containing protein [Algoriphagus halophytocola]|uniref:DUF4270 domain-containing protein n=1 Tax=Algoriphagus halophytocola TaxID=2991499 RepID=A0ABY6MGK7_9BACT|nr:MULTISPECIES: DUF4270 domain-containing protein [unclassified Algoriphagus]UZD21324.1 DUF4270 domain-containing protein [Algoriphagus sp. TR-M5]WBL42535.1 DUF4270 domain-containing protein [Algoriphagus sp. TR-M9]
MTSALKQNQKNKLTKSFTVFTPTSPVNLALGAILSLFLISSCSDPATVGIELAPGNNQIGVFFEDFELPAEVVLLDSFNTTNQAVLIVGEEEDDFFGKTSATGYARVAINPDASRPAENALLDSIFFQLNVVSVSGNDLDQPKYFSIHKLQEQILDTVYYNFDALAYEAEAFSSGEVVFGENTDSLVNMQLEEAFADEIFQKMQTGPEFNNLISFREYFPGIAIKAREGDNSTVGVGLGANTGITAYYHYEGDTVSTSYSIPTGIRLSGSTQTVATRSFSGVKSDRAGTPTQVVTEPQESYDVGAQVGMKSGVGIAIRLDTSPLDSFLDTLSGITFNQVSLEVGAIESYEEGDYPPSAFSVYFTDESNEFLENEDGAYLLVQGDGQPQVIMDEEGNMVPNVSSPVSVRIDPDTGIYGQLITSHINAIFRGDLVRKDWLLYGGYVYSKNSIGGDAFRRSLRQFVVDKNKIKVRAVYSKIR